MNYIICDKSISNENKYKDTISRAKEYAITKHHGQVRKFNNEPYVNHPIRVSEIIKKFEDTNDKMIAAALLHDTVEDTDATISDIQSKFDNEIASLVNELTSDKEEIKKIGKAAYLSKKLINMSSDALLIKLADRLDNVSDSDAPLDFKNKYYKETTIIITNLLFSNRKLSPSHRILIEKIHDMISG